MGVTMFNSATSTFRYYNPAPATYEPLERSEHRGLYALNGIAVLCHDSALETAATATATATADPRSGTAGGDGSSETTSNAAASLRRGSVWDEIKSVLVIWILCMIVGAAMIVLQSTQHH
jgi:hypothetical protein